jgi:hypothetical protein
VEIPRFSQRQCKLFEFVASISEESRPRGVEVASEDGVVASEFGGLRQHFDPARHEQSRLVTVRKRFPNSVVGQYDGRSAVGVPTYETAQVRRAGRLHAAERFVEQQHARFGHQSPQQLESSTLSPRESGRSHTEQMREPDQLGIAAWWPPRAPEHVFKRGEVRRYIQIEQDAGRLWDIAEPQPCPLPEWQRCDLVLPQPYLALVGSNLAGHDSEQGGLAGAARPEEPQDFARANA